MSIPTHRISKILFKEAKRLLQSFDEAQVGKIIVRPTHIVKLIKSANTLEDYKHSRALMERKAYRETNKDAIREYQNKWKEKKRILIRELEERVQRLEASNETIMKMLLSHMNEQTKVPNNGHKEQVLD